MKNLTSVCLEDFNEWRHINAKQLKPDLPLEGFILNEYFYAIQLFAKEKMGWQAFVKPTEDNNYKIYIIERVSCIFEEDPIYYRRGQAMNSLIQVFNDKYNELSYRFENGDWLIYGDRTAIVKKTGESKCFGFGPNGKWNNGFSGGSTFDYENPAIRKGWRKASQKELVEAFEKYADSIGIRKNTVVYESGNVFKGKVVVGGFQSHQTKFIFNKSDLRDHFILMGVCVWTEVNGWTTPEAYVAEEPERTDSVYTFAPNKKINNRQLGKTEFEVEQAIREIMNIIFPKQ